MVIVEKDISKFIDNNEANTACISNQDSIEQVIEQIKEQLKDLQKNEDIIDTKSKKKLRDIQQGDKFYGTITTTIKDSETGKKVRTQITSTFKMIDNKKNTDRVTVQDIEDGKVYNTSRRGMQLRSLSEDIEKQIQKKQLEEKLKKAEEERKIMQELGIKFSSSDTPTRIKRTIEAGIKNIWLVGSAGCGKSAMTRQVAKELGLPYLCISCGIGTSSTEFLGYKYPTRESTKFAEYYSKPSIILLDEFTSLDPAVAQICNAALANDEIETTTGTVYRNPNCIIIATSNTFGSGANRQYVANNQLDASTIDRFIGGIIEVNYSEAFESQYDSEVVNYVNSLRNIIKTYDFRRIASTRMIQAGCALKKAYVIDWKEQLIINWSDNERRIVMENLAA